MREWIGALADLMHRQETLTLEHIAIEYSTNTTKNIETCFCRSLAATGNTHAGTMFNIFELKGAFLSHTEK